jgi:hypothetical protein
MEKLKKKTKVCRIFRYMDVTVESYMTIRDNMRVETL